MAVECKKSILVSTYEDMYDDARRDAQMQDLVRAFHYAAANAGRHICHKRHGQALKMAMRLGVAPMHYRCELARDIEVALCYTVEEPECQLDMWQMQKFIERYDGREGRKI